LLVVGGDGPPTERGKKVDHRRSLKTGNEGKKGLDEECLQE